MFRLLLVSFIKSQLIFQSKMRNEILNQSWNVLLIGCHRGRKMLRPIQLLLLKCKFRIVGRNSYFPLLPIRLVIYLWTELAKVGKCRYFYKRLLIKETENIIFNKRTKIIGSYREFSTGNKLLKVHKKTAKYTNVICTLIRN